MKRLALMCMLVAACGNPPATKSPDNTDPEPHMGTVARAHDTRTPLEQRRDAACKALGPRITKCALEDSKIAARQGEITQKQLAEISAPEILAKNTAEFIEKCEAPMSSRQVRVLEVCHRAETECAPLLACLEHLHDAPPK